MSSQRVIDMRRFLEDRRKASLLRAAAEDQEKLYSNAYDAARRKWPNHDLIDVTRIGDAAPVFARGLAYAPEDRGS